MSTNIERLRYYDGEFLRGFDFDAEQRYHLEMRRRLNLALHLDGIVDGLEVVVPDPAKSGDQEPAHVNPGMAIDGFGRELVLFAPVALENLLPTQRVDPTRACSVWLVYDRHPATPPSLGYRMCGGGDQSTRWVETARVVLSNDMCRGPNSATASVDQVHYPDHPAGVTARLSDDPDGFPWAVYLGAFNAPPDNTGPLQPISNKQLIRRYVGLRAQRLVAANGAPRIEALNDLQAKKNLGVGDKFTVDKTLVLPPPTQNPFPPDTGNLNIAGDLFVKGNLYAYDGKNWLGLPTSIGNLLPEVLVGVVTPDIPISVVMDSSGNPMNPSSDVVSVSIQPKQLTTVARGNMIVALTSIKWLSPNAHDALRPKLIDANQRTEISLEVINPADWTQRPLKFQVKWTVGPVGKETVTQRIDVQSLTVSYVAVLYPNP